MARGFIRKPSFWKTVGAYRSQWKRSLRRFFFPGYGKKGMGWWRNPKKAMYNWWYYRTSISLPRMLGYKPSRGACIFALIVGSMFNLIAFPVDAAKAGTRAHKIKKARKFRAKGAATRSNNKRNTPSTTVQSNTTSHASTNHTVSSAGSKNTSPKQYTEPRTTSSPKTATRSASTTTCSTVTRKPAVTATMTTVKPIAEEKKIKPATTGFTPLYTNIQPPTVDTPALPAEPDENTPKSKPKHENDRYISKRMIIAGSSYCDRAVLDQLTVGTYIDLVAEPTNPHDKNAIMLTLNGEKIGYVPKSDCTAYISCLKLGRKVYGVITEITTEPFPVKYEFETWFDAKTS